MSESYKQNQNFFTDYLLFPLLKDVDISDTNFKGEIYSTFLYFLENVVEDETYLEYLDFDIKKNDIYYKLVGNNLITSLWFINIFPIDIEQTINTNIFIFDNKRYSYDYDNNKLIIEDFNDE